MKRYAPLFGAFLILVVAPLFFTTMMRDIFVLSKALPLSIGAFILWDELTRTGDVSFSRRTLTPSIVALLGATVLSCLLSVDTPLSLLGYHSAQFHALLPMVLYAMIYYATANTESLDPETLVGLALLGGVAVCLPAFTQIGSSKYAFMAWTIQGGRAGSTFGSPIYLGSYLAMLVPLAWDKMSNDTDRKYRTTSAEWFVVVVILAAGLIASRSRGSLIAAGCGVVLVDLLRGNRKRAALMVVAAVAATGWLFHMRGAMQSDVGRIEIYRAGISAFKLHPILGWGPDTFSLAFRQFMTKRFIESSNGVTDFIQSSAHNDLLQALVTTGVVGLLAYCYFLLGIVRSLAKNVNVEPGAVGIAGAVFALSINAKFNPIPMAVISVAACLLGSLDRQQLGLYDWPEERSRIRALGVALASLAIVGVFGVIAKAEYHQRNGENFWQMGRPVESAEQFNVAAQINPFDLWYTQRQMDYFWQVIGKMPNTNKELLATFSHNISENIARLHPADPTAHDLRSLSYEFEGDMIGRDRLWEAYNEIIVAERLAPGVKAYTERRNCIVNRVKTKSKRSCFEIGYQQAAKS